MPVKLPQYLFFFSFFLLKLQGTKTLTALRRLYANCVCRQVIEWAFNIVLLWGIIKLSFIHGDSSISRGTSIRKITVPWRVWVKLTSVRSTLTHPGWDKMATIYQMTFSIAFSWMKMFEFWLKFHWRLFLRFQLTINHPWFRWWLGGHQATSHYLNKWWLDYRGIYASLGLNELIIGIVW